jgi:uncharacterized iron-regulated membrane protein
MIVSELQTAAILEVEPEIEVPKCEESWWRTAINHPRRLWLRRALFQAHLWVGLTVGLLVALIGITGSSIVFRDRLDVAFSPALYKTAATHHAAANIDAMLDAVHASFPGSAVVEATPSEYGVWVFETGGPDPEDNAGVRQVFVDPSSDRVLGSRGGRDGIMNKLALLHVELLSGIKGRLVNGVAGLLLFFFACSGILLWWPGRARWRSALKIRPNSGAVRLNWDLHTAGGFFASWFLVVQAATGVCVSLAFLLAPIISLLTGGHKDDFLKLIFPPDSSAPIASKPSPIAPMLRSALDSCTQCSIQMVRLPAKPTDSVSFFLTLPDSTRTARFVRDTFDRNDGHRLRRIDTGSAPFGIRLVLFFKAIHFGAWGGTFSRVLWLVVGLAPGALFISGFLMWYRRVVKRRLRLAA